MTRDRKIVLGYGCMLALLVAAFRLAFGAPCP